MMDVKVSNYVIRFRLVSITPPRPVFEVNFYDAFTQLVQKIHAERTAVLEIGLLE